MYILGKRFNNMPDLMNSLDFSLILSGIFLSNIFLVTLKLRIVCMIVSNKKRILFFSTTLRLELTFCGKKYVNKKHKITHWIGKPFQITCKYKIRDRIK